MKGPPWIWQWRPIPWLHCFSSFGTKVKRFFNLCRHCLRLKTGTIHLLVMPLSSFHVYLWQWYSICYFVLLCRRFEATTKNRTKILFVPFEKILKDIKYFHRTAGTSVLDFCWCLQSVWTCKNNCGFLDIFITWWTPQSHVLCDTCLSLGYQYNSRISYPITFHTKILSDIVKDGLYAFLSKFNHTYMTYIKITLITILSWFFPH